MNAIRCYSMNNNQMETIMFHHFHIHRCSFRINHHQSIRMDLKDLNFRHIVQHHTIIRNHNENLHQSKVCIFDHSKNQKKFNIFLRFSNKNRSISIIINITIRSNSFLQFNNICKYALFIINITHFTEYSRRSCLLFKYLLYKSSFVLFSLRNNSITLDTSSFIYQSIDKSRNNTIISRRTTIESDIFTITSANNGLTIQFK